MLLFSKSKSYLFPSFKFCQVAVKIDPKMVQVDNLEYKSFATLFFQRVSVIVSDLVLAAGVHISSSNLKLPLGRNHAGARWVGVFNGFFCYFYVIIRVFLVFLLAHFEIFRI